VGVIERDLLQELYIEQGLSARQVACHLGVSSKAVTYWLRKHGIKTRSHREAMALRRLKRFHYDPPGKEKLELVGLALFWAEGTKFKKRVEVTNTDPELIKVFLRFLREVCQVEETSLHCRLQLHNPDFLAESLEYWSQVTDIPEERFTRRYLRPDKGGNPKHPYGILSVCVNDTALHELLSDRIAQISFLIP